MINPRAPIRLTRRHNRTTHLIEEGVFIQSAVFSRLCQWNVFQWAGFWFLWEIIRTWLRVIIRDLSVIYGNQILWEKKLFLSSSNSWNWSYRVKPLHEESIHNKLSKKRKLIERKKTLSEPTWRQTNENETGCEENGTTSFRCLPIVYESLITFEIYPLNEGGERFWNRRFSQFWWPRDLDLDIGWPWKLYRSICLNDLYPFHYWACSSVDFHCEWTDGNLD